MTALVDRDAEPERAPTGRRRMPPRVLGLILRFSFVDRCISDGGTAGFDEIPVLVRVGAFTRHETIGLGRSGFTVRGTAQSARTCN